jgi:hypothetical protein
LSDKHAIMLRATLVREVWMSNSKRTIALPLVRLLSLGAALLPAPASGEEWTALTLARDGTWGMATHVSRAKAIALAIDDCKQMAGRPNDCGALYKVAQGAWSLAVLCGRFNIVVAADTLAGAEAAVRARESELRLAFAQSLPPCVPLLTVQPDGIIAVSPKAQPIAAH